jgi:hypothetical protein
MISIGRAKLLLLGVLRRVLPLQTRIRVKFFLKFNYVKSGGLECFSRLEAGVGLLDLFYFSPHEDVISGGCALFFGGSCNSCSRVYSYSSMND